MVRENRTKRNDVVGVGTRPVERSTHNAKRDSCHPTLFCDIQNPGTSEENVLPAVFALSIDCMYVGGNSVQSNQSETQHMPRLLRTFFDSRERERNFFLK